MRIPKFHLLQRLWFAAVASALLLAACGGGGGGSDEKQVDVGPETPALQGTWQLSATENGVPYGGTAVVAADVVTSGELDDLTRADIARLIGATVFSGYTVTFPTTRSLRATNNVNTDYTVTINSFAASDYTGCGTCGVGSTVRFTVAANVTQGGVLNGTTVPDGTGNTQFVFTFTRTS